MRRRDCRNGYCFMIERQASRSIAIFLILPNTVRRRQCWSRTSEHHTSDTLHFLAFPAGQGVGPDNNPSNPPFAYTHTFPYIPLHALPSMHSAFKKPLTQRNWLQVVRSVGLSGIKENGTVLQPLLAVRRQSVLVTSTCRPL